MRLIKSTIVIFGFWTFSSVFAGGSSSGNLAVEGGSSSGNLTIQTAGGSSAGNLSALSFAQENHLVITTSVELALAFVPEGTQAVQFSVKPFGQPILWATDGNRVVPVALMVSPQGIPTEPQSWRALREMGQAVRSTQEIQQ
jgi:hypothetical protein